MKPAVAVLFGIAYESCTLVANKDLSPAQFAEDIFGDSAKLEQSLVWI
jgi:hypothetical protein